MIGSVHSWDEVTFLDLIRLLIDLYVLSFSFLLCNIFGQQPRMAALLRVIVGTYVRSSYVLFICLCSLNHD